MGGVGGGDEVRECRELQDLLKMLGWILEKTQGNGHWKNEGCIQ